jgi:peptidoglycan/xylan/chitin deacetylase (PgdA/CDA1 family)
MRAPRYLAKDALYAACRLAAGHGMTRAILMYHEVGGRLGPSRGLFIRQIADLSDRFRVVLLRDLPEALQLPGNVACVTFDDGYRDTIEQVVPVLDEAGVPATFFLPFGYLGKEFAMSDGDRRIVDLDRVKELVAAGHEVGSHTITHPKLTSIGVREAVGEIAGSKSALEEELGTAVKTFAYPKGDHDERVESMVREAGYRLAVTVREGLVGSPVDLFTLPRVAVNQTMGMTQFRAKLSPGLRLYERLRGRA